MHLSAAPCDLRRLGELRVDLFVGAVLEDERPFRGLVGQLSYRLAGRFEHLAMGGFLTGGRDEACLFGGSKKLPFPRVLLVGLGPRAGIDAAVLRDATRRMTDAAARLLARSVAMELPGRGDDACSVDDALDAFFEQPWTEAAAFDDIALVDRDDKRVEERLVRTRRF